MDIAFHNVDGAGFDFTHDGNDIVLNDGLVTALIHSLFRDARAPEGSIPREEDPRGHWTSVIDRDAPDGSLIWLLSREKITPDMPYRVVEILEKSCAWMIPIQTGPAAPVLSVTARANKSEGRGRVDAELILTLSHAPRERRFHLIYDSQARRYQFEEVSR
jgi:phage gp46-like protein